jgi:hypothetical protein
LLHVPGEIHQYINLVRENDLSQLGVARAADHAELVDEGSDLRSCQ